MAKSKYEVIKATRRPLSAIEAAGRKMRFGRQGALRVSDPGVAAEINAKYGGDVTVTKIDVRPKDERKTYTIPGLPWHKYDEKGNRID